MEGHRADKTGTYLFWTRGSLDRLLGLCHDHIGSCTTGRRYMYEYLGMAGVVQHGPPMTLRPRGKLICIQTRRHPISLTYLYIPQYACTLYPGTVSRS